MKYLNELILEENTISAKNMRNVHNTIMKRFGSDELKLTNHGGPVQMSVFSLEYHYIPKDYLITFECERGFLVIIVEDKNDNYFWPSMIYPEADYFHYADVKKDIAQLVDLTYKAIKENEIVFQTDRKLDKIFKWKRT